MVGKRLQETSRREHSGGWLEMVDAAQLDLLEAMWSLPEQDRK